MGVARRHWIASSPKEQEKFLGMCRNNFRSRTQNVLFSLNPQEPCPYQKPISVNKLIEDIKSGLKFGIVDYSIDVPEGLREEFSEFLRIFKNCAVSLEDNGPHN